jgi:uncharacterized protein YjbI with pentapeptide repeats
MRKKKPFNAMERWLQRIPIWTFVGYCVMALIAVAFWIQPEENLDSFRDIVRVAFYNADAIAIAAAVALYFKEIPDRKERKHDEAWQVIDNALGVETSYARYKMLQTLNKDGVTLAGIDLPGADLRGIKLRDADLRRANLQKADLQGADLSGANLQQAKLINARLGQTNLSGADLTEAALSGADLQDTNLTNAHFSQVNLSRVNLSSTIVPNHQLSQAKLCKTNYQKDLN